MSDRDVDERNENDDDHRVINDGEDDNGDTRQDNGDDNDNGVEHGSIHVSNLSFMVIIINMFMYIIYIHDT